MTVRIETPRLLIRPFREEDGEAWLALVNDSDVNRFLPGDGEAVMLEDFRQALERRAKSERDVGYAMWAVDRRDTGEFVGQCGLYLAEKKGPRSSSHTTTSRDTGQRIWHRGGAGCPRLCLRHAPSRRGHCLGHAR